MEPFSERDHIEAAEVPQEPGSFPEAGPNSLASIGQRAVGRLIDSFVLLVPALLLTLPFAEVKGGRLAGIPVWMGFLTALVIPVAYETVLISWRGQTIGKVTMGIRVARLTDGERPTAYQAGIRVALPVALALLPLGILAAMLSLVVYLMAFSHPLRQGLHDRAAGTVVVRTR
jgi:uncharacterized RDD family membrane protein YckC